LIADTYTIVTTAVSEVAADLKGLQESTELTVCVVLATDR